MHQFTRSQYMDALSDFHLLVYLATCDMLPLKVGIATTTGARNELYLLRWCDKAVELRSSLKQ